MPIQLYGVRPRFSYRLSRPSAMIVLGMSHTQVFVKRSRIEASHRRVYDWHARPGALERLTPPWENVRIVERTGGLEDGGRVTLELRVGPKTVRWVAEHEDYESGRFFVDLQLSGPFKYWKHTHTMHDASNGACTLEDRVEYQLPGGALGRWLTHDPVQNKLENLFAYRHDVTRHDLVMAQRFADSSPMRILVSGASGFIGSALLPLLTTAGHQVAPLVRPGRDATDGVRWDPQTGKLGGNTAGAQAVVHLAADNIGQGRWTAAKKQRIRDSRVQSTRKLCEALAQLDPRPHTLIAASALGYYGHRGEEWLDERSTPGDGFLAEVCQAWEQATQPAREAGIRVVNLRIGIVLSSRGGALQRMLLPFKCGLGGPIGNGRQYYSWISIDDVIGAIYHALMCDELSGPVNAMSPQPVTMREFAKTLGRVLRRPAIAAMPAFAARLAFGDMADAALLASARVRPMMLMQCGYAFRHERLKVALRHVLGRRY